MEYITHPHMLSKECEIAVMKYQVIHLRASLLTCVWALEPVRTRLGDHPGMGTLKRQKDNFGALLLEHICDRCLYFCGDVFNVCFPNLSPSIAPVGTRRSHFRRLLVTHVVTV